jgi:hypothetical protein
VSLSPQASTWGACPIALALCDKARLHHDPSKSAEILKEIAAILRGEKSFTMAQAAVLQEEAEKDGIAKGPSS